ncbi:hypothetical protein HDU96_000035 [Phlyctochytrium bullatum]|nr:hypothetical protein HDU96_000035 [Phlyctochytrium bullatum]
MRIASVLLALVGIAVAAPHAQRDSPDPALILAVNAQAQFDIARFDTISDDGKPLPADHTVLFLVENLDETRELAKLVAGSPAVQKQLNESLAVTFFAPTNDAFRRLPKLSPQDPFVSDVLLYHSVAEARPSGTLKNGDLVDTMLVLESLGGAAQKIKVLAPHDEGVFLNHMSKVVRPNIKGYNGLVHTIDRLLFPPLHIGRTLFGRPQDFSVLVLALKRTGLIDKASDAVGVTVFAPVNRAFRKLGFRKLRYLFSDAGSNELKQILAYHISTDLAYSNAVVQAGHASLPTLLDGASLKLQVQKEEDEQGHKNTVVEINDQAHVVFTDILASNGVIHGIDHVLVPPNAAAEDVKEPEADEDDFALMMEELLKDA